MTTIVAALAHAKVIKLHTTNRAGEPVDATFDGPASDAGIVQVLAACGYTLGTGAGARAGPGAQAGGAVNGDDDRPAQSCRRGDARRSQKSVETLSRRCSARPRSRAPFDLPAQGVKVCFVDTPNTQIELIEPLVRRSRRSPGSSRKNPAGGQHHVCFEVPDIDAAVADLEGEGRDGAWRAADRRARDADRLRPSEGLGRRCWSS